MQTQLGQSANRGSVPRNDPERFLASLVGAMRDVCATARRAHRAIAEVVDVHDANVADGNAGPVEVPPAVFGRLASTYAQLSDRLDRLDQVHTDVVVEAQARATLEGSS